jgi:hypothetical protein
MPTLQQEWAAFIALVPYFSFHHAAPKLGDRLLAVLRQCEESVVSRENLLLRAGLSFFADELDCDLALMQFVGEGAGSFRLPTFPLRLGLRSHVRKKVMRIVALKRAAKSG